MPHTASTLTGQTVHNEALPLKRLRSYTHAAAVSVSTSVSTVANLLRSQLGLPARQDKHALSKEICAAETTFSPSCCVIGQWVGAADQRKTEGNNNLLGYTLTWAPAPLSRFGARCMGVPEQAPASVLGFEHYLNCLHPNDVDAELQGIRTQMLNRSTAGMGRLRMRLDNTGWTHVQVRREFDYCTVNKELTGFRLVLAIDTSLPVCKD